MLAPFQMELIGDNYFSYRRHSRRELPAYERRIWRMTQPAFEPWADRLTGFADGGFVRERMERTMDYTYASRSGARGIIARYFLPPGVYEINERLSWLRAERYFVRSTAGRLERITRDEAELWLQNGC